jgi:hypothetical protein
VTLPTFLVIGAMKAGTTALNEWLGLHPDCFTAEAKELNYFSLPELYPDGLAGYERHFAGTDAVVRGEASPTYAFWPMRPDVPERIAATLPGVKLVYCVREPISRMRSNYLHARLNGTETRPLDQALLEDPRYALISSYFLQISRYVAQLPAEDLLVVTAEDLLVQDEQVLDRICLHLGLDPDRMPADLPERVHVTADKLPRASRWRRRQEVPQVSAETRERLLEQLRPDLAQLLPWLPAGHEAWGLLP